MADKADVQAVFDGTPGAFLPEKAANVNKTVQWDLTGDGGGKWYVKIADGACTVAEGEADSPNMTMTMTADDYLALMNGSLNGQQAFMTGKLKIAGDMMLAMQMQGWFAPRT